MWKFHRVLQAVSEKLLVITSGVEEAPAMLLWDRPGSILADTANDDETAAAAELRDSGLVKTGDSVEIPWCGHVVTGERLAMTPAGQRMLSRWNHLVGGGSQ
ncbi:MAG: hypothetical protein ACRDZY_00755 [Acidimicrobiales bacterium]